MSSFKSFAALNAHLRSTAHAEDMRRAANLKKVSHLPKKPGTGPRVAK